MSEFVEAAEMAGSIAKAGEEVDGMNATELASNLEKSANAFDRDLANSLKSMNADTAEADAAEKINLAKSRLKNIKIQEIFEKKGLPRNDVEKLNSMKTDVAPKTEKVVKDIAKDTHEKVTKTVDKKLSKKNKEKVDNNVNEIKENDAQIKELEEREASLTEEEKTKLNELRERNKTLKKENSKLIGNSKLSYLYTSLKVLFAAGTLYEMLSLLKTYADAHSGCYKYEYTGTGKVKKTKVLCMEGTQPSGSSTDNSYTSKLCYCSGFTSNSSVGPDSNDNCTKVSNQDGNKFTADNTAYGSKACIPADGDITKVPAGGKFLYYKYEKMSILGALADIADSAAKAVLGASTLR